MPLERDLSQLREQLLQRAAALQSRWAIQAREVTAPLVASIADSSARFRPLASESAAASIERLKSGSLHETAASLRARGKSTAIRIYRDAVLRGFLEDQRKRVAIYQRETADFVTVETDGMSSAERVNLRRLTADGMLAEVAAERDAVLLWSDVSAAFGLRVGKERGGFEAGVLALQRRVGASSDRYAIAVSQRAARYFLAGVAESSAAMNRAFETPVLQVPARA